MQTGVGWRAVAGTCIVVGLLVFGGSASADNAADTVEITGLPNIVASARGDAKITIAPSATNRIGQAHTFTVTLMKDEDGAGFKPAVGEHVGYV
ncbi:MAG: hypothetical protein ACJ74P_11095, partial [Gaiellaceae bacterium]